MAHSVSSRKRIRQNERRRVRNQAVKSSIRTQIKKVRAAVETGDPASAEAALKAASKQLDKAAGGCIHRNQASRKKARLQAAVNKMKKPKA
jgi:small subunit ribosomal protein S20